MSQRIFNNLHVFKMIQQNGCVAVKTKTSPQSPSSQSQLLDTD